MTARMISGNDSPAIFTNDRRVSDFTAYAAPPFRAFQAVNLRPETANGAIPHPYPATLATQLPTYAHGLVGTHHRDASRDTHVHARSRAALSRRL